MGLAKEMRTDSGIPVDVIYSGSPPASESGLDFKPGMYPFTRGIYSTMYRERVWTMRQYSGFGSAEETNERFRYLLQHGQTGLSVAFDLPTQLGLDADSTRAQGEVGKVGVPISTIDDMRTLLQDIPLDKKYLDDRGTPRATWRSPSTAGYGPGLPPEVPRQVPRPRRQQVPRAEARRKRGAPRNP